MGKSGGFLEAGIERGALRLWRNRAGNAANASIGELKSTTDKARALKMQLDRFLKAGDDRLMIPRVGSDAFQKVRGSDWAWRADAWRWRADTIGLSGICNGDWIGPGLRMFHDCENKEISTRQLRNKNEKDLSPFAMRFDVFDFKGSFLSMVLDLPPEASIGLKKNHIITMNISIEAERNIDIFARMNVQHGPNSEQLVRELPSGQDRHVVEFDMDLVNLNEKRIEHIWLDLIFENPSVNQITLRDLTFSRSPRADL